MQNRTEKCGAQLPPFVPASSSQQRLFRKSTTYLAKIAVVLQDAPGKMLTFTQLMDRLMPLICEDRKSVENNIRVCLSTNKCFVKVPVVPDSLESKRNYWKLDASQITAKMVRRHFKGILQLFPELASKVEMENRSGASESCSALRSAPRSPEAAACRAVQIRCEVKFSSPFSIESLLKRDAPSARASRVSPLSSVPVRAEQRPRSAHGHVGVKRSFGWDSEELLLLQASAGSSPTCSTGGSTHHGLTAAKPSKRVHVCTEASFPVYTRAGAAPYFTSPHSSYITYSVPTFTHDALRFWL